VRLGVGEVVVYDLAWFLEVMVVVDGGGDFASGCSRFGSRCILGEGRGASV